jgi:short-subunit dehydrogenase
MKKAIIIGATSGIGKSLAEILLLKGYAVGVTGRREELFQSIKTQETSKIVFKKMVHLMGGLDLFIISAGIGDENKNLNFDVEHSVIKTNIQGFTCIADWALRYFKVQGYGHLVNISSIAGIRGNGIAPSYNATKAYQINYLEGLRINAKKYGSSITITDARPGFVDTAMAKGEGLFWVAPVQKAAEQIFEAIKQKKKVVYITKRWRLIALLLRIIPFSILKRL